MDSKDYELYQEELRTELINLNESVKELREITQKQLETYVPPKDEVEVKGEIIVNTEKEVAVTNLEAIQGYLGEFSDKITEAIEKSVPEPLKSLTIENINDAKADVVKISNLDDLRSEFERITKAINELPAPIVNVAKQDIVFPKSPSEAIPVRLSDGKSFYNAITTALSNSMASYINRDNKGVPVLLESDNSVPVTIREKERETLDIYFVRNLNTFTLAQNTAIDAYTFVANAGHNFTTGDIARFKEGNRFLRATVTAVNTNTITIDQPFDYAFTTAAICARATANMNVDGSTTPVIFEISPSGTTLIDDINSISFEIIDDAQMDDTKFGGLTALTRGVLLRQVDGTQKNLTLYKSNSDFKINGVLEYSDKSGGGAYGLNARRIFYSPDWNNCIIRLDGTNGDALQIIIQDNLTGLTTFKAMAHAHLAKV